MPLTLLLSLPSTSELYPAAKPRPQALLSTPSQHCFHTNRKYSLGKSLLFPLGSSCQSEKLPLHPSLNSCGDFSLGSLGLLLAELQGKKTEPGIKKISTSEPNHFYLQGYEGKNKTPELLSLSCISWQTLQNITIYIISSLNVMSSQKSHLAQWSTNSLFPFLLHLLNLQNETPSAGAKAQQVLRTEGNVFL